MKLVRIALFCLLAPLGGCLSSGAALQSVEARPGVAALGDGLVGRIAGLQLPAEGRAKALEAEFQALQFGLAGQAVSWADGEVSGEVTPTQLYRVGSQDCRGYSHAVVAGTRAVREIGTACRTADGFWTPIA